MSAKNLLLPLGLRLWPEETQKVRRLGEGFSFAPMENSSDSYRFSALVDADRAGRLFCSLTSACLPDEAFLILEFYEEDGQEKSDQEPVPSVFYSPYLPTDEILAALSPYMERLVHDGFVGFGLANNRAGMEFFFSEEKVLTCFSGNHIRIMDLFARHKVPFRTDLTYPSDLGHDHLSLLCHPTGTLPAPFDSMSEIDLDYVHFCQALTEELEMYPVEENISFFLSEKEQDRIEDCLREHEEFGEFADDDFGGLLLDWIDFVAECEGAFEGNLQDYREGLRLRDMIQFVAEDVGQPLRAKIFEIIAEADARFKKILIDRRKRLDSPNEAVKEDRFWYLGVVRNQGATLRRDLIRKGWFHP